MPVTINGSTGIATPDGSASVPPYTGASGATNGMYFPTATSVAITANGANALTISSAQAVSIVNDASISGLTVGKGAGAVSSNTAVGASALAANTTGASNIAVGYQALLSNTTGIRNVAIGINSLSSNTGGYGNVAPTWTYCCGPALAIGALLITNVIELLTSEPSALALPA